MLARRNDATFKAVVTPIDTGVRDILAIAYPLFDSKGNYIDEDEAEPIGNQRLTYPVVAAGQMGLSKEQGDKLKKLGIVSNKLNSKQ